MHRDILGTGVHFMHACIHMHTHLIGGDADVDTSSACAHTTCVSSADNRNNKHKQVVRPYKYMSQYRSADISGVGNLQKKQE